MAKHLSIYILLINVAMAQNDSITSTISLTETRILYWNVKNHIEFVGPADYDSLALHVIGGEFIPDGKNTGYVIPTGKDLRYLKLTIVGYKNGVDEFVSAYDYAVIRLPDPDIFLSSINLNSNLNNYTDKQLIEDLVFYANYDSPLNRIISIVDSKFIIVKWTVLVGNWEITGSNKLDFEHLFAAFIKAKKGTMIHFKSFEVIAPDKTIRIIDLNSSYVKKGKSGDVIERKGWSTEPAEGG